MRAISPNIEGVEESIFEAPDGSSYAIPVAVLKDQKSGHRVLLTRWTLDDEEREQVGTHGADIYFCQIAGTDAMQPIMPTIGEPRGIELP